MKSVAGLVVETQRRHFLVRLERDTTEIRCIAKGRDQSIACGDRVVLTIQRDGGVIESVAPRTSLFYRADAFKQKIVAANVTQVVCVIAPDPPYAPSLLDRWLIAAQASDVKALIIANKSDLEKIAAPMLDHVRKLYTPLGYTVIATAAPKDALPDVSELRKALSEHQSVFIGQSGMGKSSLLNALVGDAARKIGDLSAVRNAGTHTTTHSKLFALDESSSIIDSPGMQVFGLAHLGKESLAGAFPEFHMPASPCRFRNCMHLQEPDCSVRSALQKGAISASRYAVYQELLAEM